MKHLLDNLYHAMDAKAFMATDPLGIVYELCNHTDKRIDIELGALFIAMISWEIGSRYDVLHWK